MIKVAVATSQHLLIAEVVKCFKDDTRNWKIDDVEVLLSGQTFATVAETPGGGLLTISHEDTVGSRGGKMQDMYITQFTPDGGILDRGHVPWLRHAHTAEYDEQGRLFITNTAYNEIAILGGGEKQSIFIGPQGEDTHHLNSTYIDGDDLYVMAHNGNLPEDVPGQIFHVDLATGEVADVIELPHRKCHHFFPYEGGWIYTASDDGRVVEFDPGCGGWSGVVVGGFPKGMTRVDEETAVLTCSEHTPFIERRVEAYIELAILDLPTMTIEERIPLEVANKPAGQANGLEVLDP